MKKSYLDVSVIVPVYNADKTIDRCVESLVKQQTQWSYELLFVDDGSTDDSLSKLKDWEHNNGRIRIFSQCNSGPSSARNFGLSEARGRYAVFVDSDDWVEPLYIENLRNSVIEGMRGIGIAGIFMECKAGQEIRKNERNTFYPAEYHQVIEAYRLCKQGFSCSKIYDMAVIGEDIRFDPNIHFSEDMIFMLQYLKKAEYIRFIDAVDYHYVRAESGSLISQYNSFESEVAGYRAFHRQIMDLQRLYSITDEELEYTLGYVVYFMVRAIRTIYRNGKHFLPRKERLRRLADSFDDDDRAFAYRITRSVKGIDNLIGYFMMRRGYRLLDALLWLFFRWRCSSLGNICVKWYLRTKGVRG